MLTEEECKKEVEKHPELKAAWNNYLKQKESIEDLKRRNHEIDLLLYKSKETN